MENIHFRRLQVYFFLAVFGLSLILTFFLFRPFIGTILLAGILAFLMWPVYRRIRAFFAGKEGPAAGATVFLTFVLILLPAAFVAASLATEAASLFGRLRGQAIFTDVEGTLSRFIDPEAAAFIADGLADALGNVASFAQPVFSAVTSNIITLFSNTVAILFGFFLTLFAMYYLLKDGQRLKREMLDLSPLADMDDTAIFNRIRDAIWAVAYGQFVVAVAKGIIGGLAFWLLGLDAPVFWGTMIALSSFIPGAGTAIITVPFTLYLLFSGHFIQGIILGVVSGLVIGLVDNVLAPQLINRRINIHPLLVLLSMLGGIVLFGFFGIFFGPITLSVTMALLDIYKKEFRLYLEKIK